MKHNTKVIGNTGEEYAVDYLKRKRYEIVGRNYRKRFGEIDIIAERDGTYIFVEVKTRHCNPLTRPFEAVDRRKQEKIIRTAYSYIYENHLEANYRFDVCEVFVEQDTLKLVSLNYFENAFAVEGDYGYF